MPNTREDNPAPTGRPSWTGRFPWGSVAVLLGSGLYLCLFFYHLPISNPDEGIIATGAERILRGQIPYRDFFSELGPGSFYLQAAIFKLAGLDVSALRVTAWVLGVATAWLVYLLGRQVLGGCAAFIPPLFFMTVCYPYAYLVNHHWWGNFFFLLSVLCLARLALQTEVQGAWRRRARLIAAGLLAAAALFTMQPKGAWMLVAGVAYLVAVEMIATGGKVNGAIRRGLASSGWLLLGAGASVSVVLGYFLAHHALSDWFYDNFLFPLTNYRAYVTGPPASHGGQLVHLLSLLGSPERSRFYLYVIGYSFICLIGPVIAFGGAFWQLRTAKLGDQPGVRFILLYFLAGLAGFFSEFHAADVFHLNWGAPVMLILFVSSSQWAVHRWQRLRGAVAVAAALACAAVAWAAFHKAARATAVRTAVATRRGTLYAAPEAATELKQWINAIERAVPAGGDTFFFPYEAQYYFLTATQNLSRFDVLLPGFHSPAQIEEAIATLRARRPTYIFSFAKLEPWTIRAHFPDDPPDVLAPHPVEEFLASPDGPYHRTAEVDEMEIWELRR